MKEKKMIKLTSSNEKILSPEDTAKKMNRQTEDWKKIFAKHISAEKTGIQEIKNFYNSVT